MRLENSEEYLRRQLIGLQKSKSSEPTRAPGEKRKVVSSELSHTRGGNKRLTQSDMGKYNFSVKLITNLGCPVFIHQVQMKNVRK